MRQQAAAPRKGGTWTGTRGTAGRGDAKHGPRFSGGALLLLAVAAAGLQTCRLGGTGMPTPVFMSGDAFTLAWDPPSPAPQSEVTSWRVYARPHGTIAWTELEEIPVDEGTRCTITRGELGDGDFDLAVSSVDSVGRESVLHSSTDADAWPVGGWYLQWRG